MSTARYTIREAADLTGLSTDTIRRRYRDGLLPGAGPDSHDPTGAIRISREALVAAGLLAADATAGDADDVIGRRRAERERGAAHAELVALRAEKTAWAEQRELLETQLRNTIKLAQTLASALDRGRAA